jgi:hypothetical protein
VGGFAGASRRWQIDRAELRGHKRSHGRAGSLLVRALRYGMLVAHWNLMAATAVDFKNEETPWKRTRLFVHMLNR